MRNIVGQAVTGRDFFDRPQQLNWIWDRISVSNILLTAPRRSGKTSLMFHLRDQPRHDYHGVFVNVEGASGAGQMIYLIIKALQDHPNFSSVAKSVVGALASFFGREIKVETPIGSLELGRDIEKNWEFTGEELLRRLRALEKEGKQRLLLLIDEFPILLDRLRKQGEEGQREAIQLLHWFRALRIDPAFTGGRVRFVFSGSIGLEGAVSRLGASKSINDLEILPVDPLSPLDAMYLLERLNTETSSPVLKDEATRRHLLTYLEEPFPFYVQLFFKQAAQHARKLQAPCDERTIDQLYEQELLGLTGETSLKHMDERLNDALTDTESGRVRALLDKVARSKSGVLPKEAERVLSGLGDNGHYPEASGSVQGSSIDPQNHHALRQLLIHDGYLREHEGKLVFRTRLLRDFWKRHRGIRR